MDGWMDGSIDPSIHRPTDRLLTLFSSLLPCLSTLQHRRGASDRPSETRPREETRRDETRRDCSADANRIHRSSIAHPSLIHLSSVAPLVGHEGRDRQVSALLGVSYDAWSLVGLLACWFACLLVCLLVGLLACLLACLLSGSLDHSIDRWMQHP